MPYGITQYYLPPGRGDIPAVTPAEAGTRTRSHNISGNSTTDYSGYEISLMVYSHCIYVIFGLVNLQVAAQRYVDCHRPHLPSAQLLNLAKRQ